jgi:heptaprenylglyceryl phosphate synthase
MFANRNRNTIMNIYNQILTNKQSNKKSFALLIDPDKQNKSELISIIEKAKKARTDYFFVGGSLLTNDSLDTCLATLKENSDIPVVLFPGDAMQVNDKADGILFLSLISGRYVNWETSCYSSYFKTIISRSFTYRLHAY